MRKTLQHYTTIPNALYFEQVKTMLSQAKVVKIPVAGNSMLPFLRARDVVALRTPASEVIYRGKIVLANYNKGYVLHRVVHASAKFVFLAGNNNFAQVECINREDVIAVVQEAYRNGRPLHINAHRQVFRTWLWHQMRPFRYVYGKLIKWVFN